MLLFLSAFAYLVTVLSQINVSRRSGRKISGSVTIGAITSIRNPVHGQFQCPDSTEEHLTEFLEVHLLEKAFHWGETPNDDVNQFCEYQFLSFNATLEA